MPNKDTYIHIHLLDQVIHTICPSLKSIISFKTFMLLTSISFMLLFHSFKILSVHKSKFAPYMSANSLQLFKYTEKVLCCSSHWINMFTLIRSF